MGSHVVWGQLRTGVSEPRTSQLKAIAFSGAILHLGDPYGPTQADSQPPARMMTCALSAAQTAGPPRLTATTGLAIPGKFCSALAPTKTQAAGTSALTPAPACGHRSQRLRCHARTVAPARRPVVLARALFGAKTERSPMSATDRRPDDMDPGERMDNSRKTV